MRACVVRTGVANTASVAAALTRCGIEPVLSTEPGEIERADLVVLPGVGSFGSGMRALKGAGIDALLSRRVADGRATLCVCLGMQLLAESSEESPGVEGLGVIPARVTRFPDHATVPQFGWNTVTPDAGRGPVEPGYAYFANSYRYTGAPVGWGVAYTEHGGRFVSALWRGRVVACQFHPELSGAWGMRLIRGWALAAQETAQC